MVDTARLSETKTDLSRYIPEMKKMGDGLIKATITANNSESLTRNMIDFIHKYEPIFI